MRIFITVSLIFIGPLSFAKTTARFVPGELLVQYKPEVSEAKAIGKINRSGRRLGQILEKPKYLRKGPLARMRVSDGETLDQAIQNLKLDPEVESVDRNWIFRINTVPNDPAFTSYWGLHNTGQTISTTAGSSTLGPESPDATNNPGTAGKDMNMETAWNSITDCSSVIVAVIDTGIKYDHEDLASNMWNSANSSYPHHGYNFVSGTNDPLDDHGHGTHVSGTIGAVGNNSLGGTGICWQVQLMALKALDSNGEGSMANIISAINFAVANGANVINMSLGGQATASEISSMTTAFQNANSAGVVVAVAAGNDGDDNGSSPVYPCNIHLANMICVAALDQKYALADFSNYSTTYVDVGAPGTNIVSSWPYSFARVTDSMNSWTSSPTGAGTAWTAQTFNSYGGGLMIPSTWTGAASSNDYANNATATSYKAFTLSGTYDKLGLEYMILYNLGTGDSIIPYAASGSGSPFSGSQLDSYTGLTGGYLYGQNYDLTTICPNTSCSVGFQFSSDNSVVNTGAVILEFDFLKQTKATNTYNVIEGTSMATPHVAGLAALVKAYQPSYTVTEIVAAIKNGGLAANSLNGKTTTGKSIDAPGSLSYINPPSGVTASP